MRLGAEQVDAHRLVILHQPPCHLFDDFLLCELRLRVPGFVIRSNEKERRVGVADLVVRDGTSNATVRSALLRQDRDAGGWVDPYLGNVDDSALRAQPYGGLSP